ncbi:hypothetical protein [Thioflexithrix psekupsensis]|uniref:Uncharacterized protein n=1 Tax=Thioflexithrix psekupsensis TaxID=1570016 RepID=A0A251X8J5_9GAMM|nr:hypothetical protein [Thioflexithrix psekupsensis]OUD14104.1 hypothetical protein TPSD3_07120 [Thioflexithrix psekupsensis]
MQFALYRLGVMFAQNTSVSAEQWWREVELLLGGSRLKASPVIRRIAALPNALTHELTKEELQILEAFIQQCVSIVSMRDLRD